MPRMSFRLLFCVGSDTRDQVSTHRYQNEPVILTAIAPIRRRPAPGNFCDGSILSSKQSWADKGDPKILDFTDCTVCFTCPKFCPDLDSCLDVGWTRFWTRFLSSLDKFPMLSNVFPFHAAISPSKQLGGGWNESILSCCWWDSFQFPQVSNRFPGQEFWTKGRTKVRTTETHCTTGNVPHPVRFAKSSPVRPSEY